LDQAAEQARPEVLPGSQQQQQEDHQSDSSSSNSSSSGLRSSNAAAEAQETDVEPQIAGQRAERQQVVQQQQSSATQAEQQQEQQDGLQQQQSGRSPEQLQLQYLRHQALTLQALEDYQQLMQQYPSSSSSSSSKQRSATSASEQQQQQQQSADPPDVPVLDAALLIAKHAHPELDAAAVKQQLDDLAAEVEAGLPSGVRYPLRVIKEINRVLYEVHGFSGNTEDYCEC
jgi:hypothetical protein